MNQVEKYPSRGMASQVSDAMLQQQISRLERQLSRYVGAKHCVVVPNPLTGLRIALKAAGVGGGDQVLCTTYGQFSTAQTIAGLGARPVYVDINPNTYNMDPYCLEYVITKLGRMKSPPPKVMVTMDLFGLPCNYHAIEEVCSRYGIILIEDMTHAFGASFQGRKTGQFGRFAVGSFQGTKVQGAVENDGMVFCHTPEDEEALRKLAGGNGPRIFQLAGEGWDTDKAGMHLSVVGEQLRQFQQEYERRQKIAARYRERLTGHLKLQQVGEHMESAYAQFVVSMKDNDMRMYVMDKLLEEQIPCSIYYPIPLHQRETEMGERIILANAERVAQKLLVLPMHSYLTNHVVDYICEQLLSAVDSYHHREKDATAMAITI